MNAALRRRADGDLAREERAFERSFAPLRARTTALSPARVRAAVRWSEREEQRRRAVASRWGRIAGIGRLAELSVGLGVTAFLFAGAGSVPPAPQASQSPAVVPAITAQQRVASDDSARFVRWMRTGALGPFEPLQNEIRIRGGDVDRAPAPAQPEPADELTPRTSVPR